MSMDGVSDNQSGTSASSTKSICVFEKYSLSGGCNTKSLGGKYGDITSLTNGVSINVREVTTVTNQGSSANETNQVETVTNQGSSAIKNVSKEKIEQQINIIDEHSKKIGDAMSDALYTGSVNLGIIGENGLLQQKELFDVFKGFVDSVCSCLKADKADNIQHNMPLNALSTFKFFYAGKSVGAFKDLCLNKEITDIKVIFTELKTFLDKKDVFDINSGCPLIQEFMAVQMLCRMNDVVQNSSTPVFNGISSLNAENQREAVKKIREHEMFYEIHLDKLDDAIIEAMMTKFGTKIELSVKGKNSKGEISKDNLTNLAKHFLKMSRDIDGDGQTCGMRGRMKAPNLSAQVANRGTGEYKNFYALINGENNIESDKGKKLCEILKSNKAFPDDSVERPKQFAVEGMLLPSRVAIINNPIAFLNDCLSTENITAYNKDNPENSINEEKSFFFEENKELNKEISQAICDRNLPKQGGSFKKIIDLIDGKDGGPYESKPNLVSAMKKAGLCTICSVSGTTTDIVSVLWAMKKENTEKALKSLNDFVESLGGEDTKVDHSKLNDDFKRLFLSIAVYMQSGKYHSAAEVLGGLYSAAQVLCNNIKAVDVKKYEQLFTEFVRKPDGFFPKAGTESDDK